MKHAVLALTLLLSAFGCTPEPELAPEAEEAPVAEYIEPAEIEVDEWLVGLLDDTGNDVSGDAEPFLPATAPRPFLNPFEERGLSDVIKDVGHG